MEWFTWIICYMFSLFCSTLKSMNEFVFLIRSKIRNGECLGKCIYKIIGKKLPCYETSLPWLLVFSHKRRLNKFGTENVSMFDIFRRSSQAVGRRVLRGGSKPSLRSDATLFILVHTGPPTAKPSPAAKGVISGMSLQPTQETWKVGRLRGQATKPRK